MIGELPKTLIVNSKEWTIRTDYRVVLLTFLALNDPDLKEDEKAIIMLNNIYEDAADMEQDDYAAALDRAVEFMDGSSSPERQGPSNCKSVKLYDWEQDEQMIFSAINKVAGCEVREKEYLHWWTFLGYFNEIGEGLFSLVVNIRNKKACGKKLEKHETKFYKKNKDLIDLKKRYSEAELEYVEYYKNLLK